MKKYILIAGVNGAGKSTLYQTFGSLKNMPRVNTDEYVREFGDWRNSTDVLKAGRIAINNIKQYFKSGITFNQETTLCGNSIIRNIKNAKSMGYEVEVHYVGVDSVDIAKKRIAYRVVQGGHGIPDADVERRYNESIDNLRKIIKICDMVVLYDNTKAFNRFAIYNNGQLINLSDEQPNWYKRLNLLEY